MLAPLGPLARGRARSIVHGMARSFVGDHIADELAIDDDAWKYVPRVMGPIVAIMYGAGDLLPGSRARRLERNLAIIDEKLAQQSRQLGVTHDLVDRADDHHANDHPAQFFG